MKIGTKEWHDAVTAAMRKRHGVKDDQSVGLTVMPADVDVDKSDPYLFSATITKRVLDRDGEVVLPSGGIFTEFDTSGAIFWNHEYNRPVASPVGELTRDKDTITAKGRFMERAEGSQGEFLPDYARAFVTSQAKVGKAAGVSIGFIALEERKPTTKDKEEFGPDVRNVITKWKMLEWSIAPVQANQESFVTAVGKSIGAPACKALFDVDLPDVEPEPDPAPAEDNPSKPPRDTESARKAARSAMARDGAVRQVKMIRSAVAAAKSAREAKRRAAAKRRREAQHRDLSMVGEYARAKSRGELWVGQYK